MRVGIVILFGVCATLLARGFEVGEEAEVWELRPYGQISKRKHSFVCKCYLNLSDGCKDVLSSRCPRLLSLGGKCIYLIVYVKDTDYFTVCFAQTFHFSLGLRMPASQQSSMWGLSGSRFEK